MTYLHEITKKPWPRWALGPKGNRAIFHCAGDVPPKWKLEIPLPVDETQDPEVAGLRAAYQAVTGKKANAYWDAATLKAKLTEKAAA